MTNRHIALCIDRGGVPHLEPDLALQLLQRINNNSTPQQPQHFFVGSYFDAQALVPACRATKRDLLTEMALRNTTSTQATSTQHHIMVPRSGLFSCSNGLPAAEAGPCSDQYQGRVTMTVEKWIETAKFTKPDVAVALCELISIPEMLSLPARKKQTLHTRNVKWLDEILTGLMASNNTDSTNNSVVLAFCVGTHFTTTAPANAAAVTDDTALATVGVTVDVAPFTKWTQFVVGNSAAATTPRYINIPCLGAGETPDERRQFLNELASALQAAEANVAATIGNNNNNNNNNNSSKLRFIVGNITDKQAIIDFEEIFTSKGLLQQHSDVIYVAAHLPSTLASRGLALQRNEQEQRQQRDNNGVPPQIVEVCQESRISQRRGRDAEDASTIAKKQTESDNAASAGSGGAFNVINLRDPAFKFSRDPLSIAAVEEDDGGRSSALRQCPCMACERHTAGYLHHLLDVHEMNAEILLSIHNWSQWIRYLRE